MGFRIVHQLDDSRLIINSSGGNNGKIYREGFHHIPPYQKEIRLNYLDHHTALSAIQLMESDLLPVDEHNHYTQVDSAIVYWGEVRCYAGTFNAPLIDAQGRENGKGFDRNLYMSQSRKLNDLFVRCQMKGSAQGVIQDVFDITRQAAKGQYYTNGRLGQVIMSNNSSDGYAVNGWSPGPDMPDEWASAIVDQNRNMNALPEDMNYWNRPLQIAIFRQNGKYFNVGDTVRVKICLINEEKIAANNYDLKIKIKDGAGMILYSDEVKNIQVEGGNVFAQTLLDDFSFILGKEWRSGYVTVEGTLMNGKKCVADGKEQVLLRNRPSQKERLKGRNITVMGWPQAEKALTDACGNLSLSGKKKGVILLGKEASETEWKNALERVKNGDNLIIQTDTIAGKKLYDFGLIDQPVKAWGGVQTGHWNGNGSSYIEIFPGDQTIASGKTISTRSWEAIGNPRGFYPFSSKFPLKIHGLYVANHFDRDKRFSEETNVLVTYGEITYGKGVILLNAAYWVDEDNVFADLLFYNMVDHYSRH